jgi:hypothetical protein
VTKIAESHKSSGVRPFVSYYWMFLKHVGRSVWESRGRELLSALLLALVTFVVSYLFKQVDALAALEIAVLSLIGWLSAFAVIHIIRAPLLLHHSENHASARSESWVFGLLGAVMLTVIIGSVAGIGMWWWTDREPKFIFPIPDASALQAEIEQRNREIAALKAQVPIEDSLKVRSLKAADEYEQWWRRQSKSPDCNQTSTMTPEEQRKAIEPCAAWFSQRQADYQRLLAPRIMEIVQEFKAKGVDDLNIENCAASGFCGIPLSVQLRSFSLRLDGQDHLKH